MKKRVARRVSSNARSGQMLGSASDDPMMVMDSPSTANGANGSERTRGNQSADLLTHRLERIELLSDHRDWQRRSNRKASHH